MNSASSCSRRNRAPIPAGKGRVKREDSEYIREGSATAFLVYAPLEGTRAVHISEDGRRTASDYADVIEYLVDEMFPNAEKIVLVEDNLNTHKDASLYEAFSPGKARRLTHPNEDSSFSDSTSLNVNFIHQSDVDALLGSYRDSSNYD